MKTIVEHDRSGPGCNVIKDHLARFFTVNPCRLTDTSKDEVVYDCLRSIF